MRHPPITFTYTVSDGTFESTARVTLEADGTGILPVDLGFDFGKSCRRNYQRPPPYATLGSGVVIARGGIENACRHRDIRLKRMYRCSSQMISSMFSEVATPTKCLARSNFSNHDRRDHRTDAGDRHHIHAVEQPADLDVTRLWQHAHV